LDPDEALCCCAGRRWWNFARTQDDASKQHAEEEQRHEAKFAAAKQVRRLTITPDHHMHIWATVTINGCVPAPPSFKQTRLETFNTEHAKRKHAFENSQKPKRQQPAPPVMVDHKAGSAASGGTQEG
jgi:rhamnose utilization protein RhaD (predicted bifunctional aldolase and dehydrogenase)